MTIVGWQPDVRSENVIPNVPLKRLPTPVFFPATIIASLDLRLRYHV